MKTRKLLLSAMAGGSALLVAAPAQAQEYYLGQIILVANSFCQKGSAEANGAILPIMQYTALFSLYGNTYGGNGTTTFALPDLRGRAAINWGQGPGLSDYVLGQVGGTETTTLTYNQLPIHTHAAVMRAVAGNPTTTNPQNAAFADYPSGVNIYNKTTPPDANMAPNTAHTGPAGNSQPVQLHSPYLVLRFCVMMQGIFPSRP